MVFGKASSTVRRGRWARGPASAQPRLRSETLVCSQVAGVLLFRGPPVVPTPKRGQPTPA